MRKSQVVTLTDGGKQKNFKITQMSATKAENTILKLILLLGGEDSIKNLDDLTDFKNIIKALADQPYDKVQEILDALLSCVSSIKDGGIEFPLNATNVDDEIDDVKTLFMLRVEAFKLNNFFQQSEQNPLSESQKFVTIPRKK
jgi:hypothetical protein